MAQDLEFFEKKNLTMAQDLELFSYFGSIPEAANRTPPPPPPCLGQNFGSLAVMASWTFLEQFFFFCTFF